MKKSTKNNTFAALAIAAVVAAGCYVAYLLGRPKREETATGEVKKVEEQGIKDMKIQTINGVKDEITPVKGIVFRDDSFPLSVGSKGARVFVLQRYLNLLHKAKIKETGKFTENMIPFVKTAFGGCDTVSQEAWEAKIYGMVDANAIGSENYNGKYLYNGGNIVRKQIKLF